MKYWVTVLLLFMSFGSMSQEIEVSFNSSYVDVGTLNADIGENPNVGVSASYEFGNSVYIDGYVIAGTENGFSDTSSEYGFEVGKSWSVNDDLSLIVAVGRWANYAGEGLSAGDNMLRVEIEYKNLNLGTTLLKGESDTTLVHGSYLVEVDDWLSFTTSLSLDTESGIVNPGLQMEVEVGSSWFVGIDVVYPEEEGERHLSHSINLMKRW